MHTKLFIAHNRKIVFLALMVDYLAMLARRYKCPIPPI
jgi:hypothetical protein